MKEGIKIVSVTKKEVDYLLTKGLKYGVFDSDLHKTHSRYNKYYMTETPKNMKILLEYRESIKVNTK